MSEFDLRALIEALHEREVAFVVIGGIAVTAHGYTQLAEDAVESQLFGIPVRICSLARLREMKEAQSRAQDKADLENLPEE